jgi:shikimate kinase
MKIILVGVSCVGKSTVGKMLADKVGYKFFDFDFEIEKYFNKPISILKRKFITEHSFREKASIVLIKILKENDDNFIISMVPSGLMDYYWKIIKKHDSLVTIALKDKAKNILKRIRFFDDYSNPIEIEITKENEKHYLKEISLDIEYFGRTYKKAKIQKNIDGKSASQVVDELKDLLFEDK